MTIQTWTRKKLQGQHRALDDNAKGQEVTISNNNHQKNQKYPNPGTKNNKILTKVNTDSNAVSATVTGYTKINPNISSKQSNYLSIEDWETFPIDSEQKSEFTIEKSDDSTTPPTIKIYIKKV